jgi:hypothetical protein
VPYFDTGFLAPLIFPEATSDQIAAFVRRLPAEEFTVSHWTRVEFSSLIARAVRMGGLERPRRGAAIERPRGSVDSAPKWVVLKIIPEKITSWTTASLRVLIDVGLRS